jgi:hypothetical protein
MEKNNMAGTAMPQSLSSLLPHPVISTKNREHWSIELQEHKPPGHARNSEEEIFFKFLCFYSCQVNFDS